MIVIGDVKAAAQPLCDGLALIASACCTTCCFTVESQFAGVIVVGAWKACCRRANGSVIEGRTWKNWTPAAKLLRVKPVSGSIVIPVGRLTLMKTVRGPKLESASRI